MSTQKYKVQIGSLSTNVLLALHKMQSSDVITHIQDNPANVNFASPQAYEFAFWKGLRKLYGKSRHFATNHGSPGLFGNEWRMHGQVTEPARKNLGCHNCVTPTVKVSVSKC